MGANTNIEWAHHSCNFWWGCTYARYIDGSVREECVHCYAKLISALFSKGKATWGADGKRWLRQNKAMDELLKLDAKAQARGVRERVFINSMSDTFEDRDDLNPARALLWIAAYAVTNLDLLLLTKRPGNVMRMVPPHWATDWPAHVWIGTTAGTQKAADENVPALLSVPAKVRFLSCEPLLGPVELPQHALHRWISDGTTRAEYLGPRIHWVIAGGESGAGARPMHPAWARSLRDQCAAAGVAFFFKQWGEWIPAFSDGKTVTVTFDHRGDNGNVLGPKNPQFHTFADGQIVARVGKKAAGRELDCIDWNGVPEAAA